MNSDQRNPAMSTFSGRTFDDKQFSVALDYTRVVGKGGTAKIYIGEILGSQPLVVAVKVFDKFIADIEKELLRRELQATRQVASSHDLILGFLGTADIGQETAIVSHYMKNGNLMQYIQAHPGCDKKKLIRQVAEALNFLHTEKNLVHGDIKSANILISDSGDALLSDFGLSTFIEKTQDAVTTVSAIRDMYTLRFAAPELVAGGDPDGPSGSEYPGIPTSEQAQHGTKQRSKTRESDVYAFGMLVLEVVTENHPWNGFRPAAVVLQVSTGKYPPRPTKGPLVSMSHLLWELCLDCWRPNPKERITMDKILELFKTEHFDIAPVRTIKTVGGEETIAFMPSGRHIVSGSSSGVVSIRDTGTGLTVVGPLRGHTSFVLCVAASPTGEIASSSWDRTIRRWNTTSGTPVDESTLETAAQCITYSPDGSYLACGEAHSVRMWNAYFTGAVGYKLTGQGGTVNALAFSPNSAQLASASDDGTVRVWDVATLSTASILVPGVRVNSIAFSPDGGRLAAAGPRAVRIWNVWSGSVEIELAAETSRATVVAFSPAGNWLAAFGNGMARIWDAQTGHSIYEQPLAQVYLMNSLALSQDRKSLAYCDMDGGLVVWDLFA